MHRWFELLFPRNWGRLSRALIGDFNYKPPQWCVNTFHVVLESMMRRPGVWASMIVLAGLLTGGGWYGNKWWDAHKPRPRQMVVMRDISGKLKAPLETPVIKGKPEPQPVMVTFSDSVAPLEAIGKDNPKGVSISLKHEGTWRWVSDRSLSFSPKTDWPAGTDFVVKLDAALLPKEVRLKEAEWKFKTVPLTPHIISSEFYTDIKDPAVHQVVVGVRFNHPVLKSELDKHIGIEVLGVAALFAPKGQKPPVPFTIVEGDDQRQFFIRTSRITIPEKEDYVRVTITKGITTTNGGVESADAVSAKVTVPDQFSGFAITETSTENIRTAEGEPEQYLFVNTKGYSNGEELAKHVQMWLLPRDRPLIKLKDSTIPFEKNHEWSNTGEVTPEVLALAKPVPLKLVETSAEDDAPVSTRHGFKFLLEAKGHVFVQITKGVQALGGFRLKGDRSEIVNVPVFPKEVEIMGKGGVLALNGERKISIKTRGVQHLRYTLSRVPVSQVNHLARFTGGNFQSPHWKGDIDEENIAHIRRKVVTVPMANEYQSNFTSFDFTEALQAADTSDPDASRGLYFIEVEGVKPRPEKVKKEGDDAEDADRDRDYQDEKEARNSDPAIAKWVPLSRRSAGDDEDRRGSSAQDRRFILVSDLGLIVKRNADATREMFVQSISHGEPAANAVVTVLAKNGEFLEQATTDASGHAHLKSFEGLTNEQLPVAITARVGNDVSFLPYNRRFDRQLNYSRFDTGGILASENKTLDAFLFTERGIYRPGDKIHISGIIRQRDWLGKLDGLPMELDILNSKDQTIRTEKIALPADGFFDHEASTEEDDPTGRYHVNLYLIGTKKKRTLLGGTSFRVEDFQPDRMKAELALNVPENAGWILPNDVKATITVKTLFGFPAENRNVKARLELSPARFAFEQFPDFIFHNRLERESQNNDGEPIELGEQKTNAEGKAEFNLALDRFAGGCYEMELLAEGFETDGGRSVRTSKTLRVSPLPYVIGYKADGALGYIGKDSQRNIQLISVGPDLKPVAQPALMQRLVQIKYVSMLTKQQNESYAYVSTRRENMVREAPYALPVDGATLALPTANAGEYRLELRDNESRVVLACPFSIVGKGDSQRSLERNAELEVKLARNKWTSGEALELSMNAPYTGAGLMTIEREKVLSWQWFKSPTTSSTQHIPVPNDIEGTAYVNVSFVRALDSPEIFMSPLSYAVHPFTANSEKRRFTVELDAPKLVKPGTDLKIGFKAAKPCRIVVYAVDAGIHQVSDYKLPQPLDYFNQKRAHEVETEQLLDLILPEFSLIAKSKAFGGDQEPKLHMNAFKRRKEPPVVFWSGIIEAGPERRETTYRVPDYFAGKLNIMAVAVAMDGIGAAETSCIARGPMVLTPNVPVFASPGDEFIASLTVANSMEGPNATSQISLTATGTEHLELIGGGTQAAEIAPGKEGTVRFRVRVKDSLGGAEIVFTSTGGGESMERRATLSVRPAAPFITNVQSGYFRLAKQDVPVKRTMYPQFRKLEATVSTLPLGLARGLDTYLHDYPHGCSEQITSRAVSRLLLAGEVDFGFDKAQAVQQLDDAFALLRSRQHGNGGFGYWDSHCDDAVDFLSVYVTHFLTEAREAGYAVPGSLLDAARNRMTQIARTRTANLHDAGIQAAAIYLLTRNGEVTTNQILNLRDTLEHDFKDKWFGDVTAAYLASTYVLLKQEKEGRALMAAHRKAAPPKADYSAWRGWYYAEPQVRNAQVFALTCRHFPEIAGKFGYDDIGVITEPLAKNRFNTISSAWSILALKAYSQLAKQADVKLSISELPRAAGDPRLIIPESIGLLTAPFSADAGTLRFQLNNAGKKDLGAFYQVTEKGFDTGLPTEKIADGLEVVRDLLDKNDKPVSQLKVGEGCAVRLRVRNISPDNIENIALLDMLPGGFEVEAGTLTPGLRTIAGADFVEVREDRNVFFCGVRKGEVLSFTYRIKPVTAGTFVIPPVFAESMYDRGIKGRSGGGKITVNSAE